MRWSVKLNPAFAVRVVFISLERNRAFLSVAMEKLRFSLKMAGDTSRAIQCVDISIRKLAFVFNSPLGQRPVRCTVDAF
jgi:hypothetical protein